MNTTYASNTKTIASLLLCAALVLLMSSWYVENQRAEYRAALAVTIANQETRMTALADLSDRDGVDTVVNELIKDCELDERERFDTLLGSLSQLRRAELLEVEQLFKVCGGYFADRKAILIARLQREFEVYQQYIELLAISEENTVDHNVRLGRWDELVTAEKERSTLTSRLVVIQKEIIDALITGEAVNSEAISEKLKEAQDVKDTLVYLDANIDTMRSSILGI